MRIQLLKWTVAVIAVGLMAPAQVLSPVTSGSSTKEKRQVRIVTLTRWGFEPPELGVNPGKITILVRDLTGSVSAPVELRQGSKTGSVLETKKQQSEWRLMEEMQLDLKTGEYNLNVADSKGRSLKITVGEK